MAPIDIIRGTIRAVSPALFTPAAPIAAEAVRTVIDSFTRSATGSVTVVAATAPVVTTVDKRSATQKRLDEFKASYEPTYEVTINGVTSKVKVRAQFRMKGATGQPNKDEIHARLYKAFDDHKLWSGDGKLDRTRIRHMEMGRGTPNDVKVLTEKLIKAGLLPAGITDPESAVRHLQWHYGIGVDCVGYTAQAVAAGQGTTTSDMGIAGVITKGEGFYAPSLASFRKVKMTELRAGDVVRLEEWPVPGVKRSSHNVVVYDRHSITSDERKLLDNGSKVFEKGDVHIYSLDSSWGTQGNPDYENGGVCRQRWLYNATNNTWATIDDTTSPPSVEITNGPYNHELVGGYRPR